MATPTPSRTCTLRLALYRIAHALVKPAMILHTGDVSHLSKPEEFDMRG